MACESDSRGRLGLESVALPEAEKMRKVLQAALQINAGEIAKQHAEPEHIKQAIFEARLIQVNTVM